MRLFRRPSAVSASSFSATTVSRGYTRRTGAGKSSKVGYSISVGPGVITSPNPISSCMGTRALASVRAELNAHTFVAGSLFDSTDLDCGVAELDAIRGHIDFAYCPDSRLNVIELVAGLSSEVDIHRRSR